VPFVPAGFFQFPIIVIDIYELCNFMMHPVVMDQRNNRLIPTSGFCIIVQPGKKGIVEI